MKKYLFYMAMAVVALGGFTACSSDDDDDSNDNKVTLSSPKYADQAVEFSIPEKNRSQVASTNEAVELAAINITESGKSIVEVECEGKKYYASGDATVNGDSYTLDGTKVRGQVRKTVATKASENVALTISLTIDIEGLGQIKFTTSGDDPVTAVQNMGTLAGDNMNYLMRSWRVEGLIVDLKGNPNVYKEFTGGSLKQVLDEVKARGYNFNDSEVKALSKTVQSITFTKTGIISIVYSDYSVDAATWSWLGNQYDQLSMKLKEGDMGNKFLTDDTKLDVAFKEDRCNLKLSTKITGAENYDIALTIKLKAIN